jgi:nuclear pore complex protein Nup98-Nup96
MARFRAFASESSSSDEDDQRPTRPLPHRPSPPKKPVKTPAEDDESAEEEALTESEDPSSESSSLDMREDELAVTVRGGSATRKTNALVHGEDGEIRYAHEVDGQTRVAPLAHDPTIIPWAQQLGVDAQKMHVMQTSLFRMPEEAAALKAIYKPDPQTSRKRLNIYSPPKPRLRKHGRESDVEGLRSDSREVCRLPRFKCL